MAAITGLTGLGALSRTANPLAPEGVSALSQLPRIIAVGDFTTSKEPRSVRSFAIDSAHLAIWTVVLHLEIGANRGESRTTSSGPSHLSRRGNPHFGNLTRLRLPDLQLPSLACAFGE